ncbi:MAG: MBL fold metallo-hydrolase [Candidatus Sericytochromatia bacterium]|nr:MBL fold metallo-hydrolase [Candidatus Sericytochromatia bacterium]
MGDVRFSLLAAGHCTVPGHLVLPGTPRRPCRFPALVGLIEHPRHGLVLFDTGYTERFHAATRRGVGWFYGKVTPVTFAPEQAIAAQLRARGHDPADVRWVVLSHLHGDHVAGTQDFPRARFVYVQSAHERLQRLGRVRQVMHAYLAELLPRDFSDRALPIESLPVSPLGRGGFPGGRDLFGDGSVVLVDLPGHAWGHVGALVAAQDGDWLMAGDACWASEAVRRNVLPARRAQWLFPDRGAYRDTLGRLHALHLAQPDLRIVPSHCEEAAVRWGALAGSPPSNPLGA